MFSECLQVSLPDVIRQSENALLSRDNAATSHLLPRDFATTSLCMESVSVNTAEGLVFAGNEINIKAENCTNSRVAGVFFEQHFHYQKPSKENVSQDQYDVTKGDTDQLKYERKGLSKLYRMEEGFFIPLLFDKETKLCPKDHFVQLDMEQLDETGRLHRKTTCDFGSILETEDGSSEIASHVLIRGDAGYGKSTLCTKIGYDWANGVDTFRVLPAKSTFLVLFRLRDLEEGSDLEKELVQFVHSRSTDPDQDVSVTIKALRRYSGTLLLVLDGYDEARPEHQAMVKEQILKQRKKGPQSPFQNAALIITSRLVEDPELLFLFDRHFRITGLSPENINGIARNFLRSEGLGAEEVEAVSELISEISIPEISPILIVILCYVYKNKDRKNIIIRENARQFDIFIEAMFLMAKRCNERDSLALSDEEIWNKLGVLGKYFFHCLKNDIIVMPETELQEHFKHDYNFLTRSGIIKIPFSPFKKYNVFEPLHKTLMETLADNWFKLELQKLGSHQERWNYIQDLGLILIETSIVLECQERFQVETSLHGKSMSNSWYVVFLSDNSVKIERGIRKVDLLVDLQLKSAISAEPFPDIGLKFNTAIENFLPSECRSLFQQQIPKISEADRGTKSKIFGTYEYFKTAESVPFNQFIDLISFAFCRFDRLEKASFSLMGLNPGDSQVDVIIRIISCLRDSSDRCFHIRLFTLHESSEDVSSWMWVARLDVVSMSPEHERLKKEEKNHCMCPETDKALILNINYSEYTRDYQSVPSILQPQSWLNLHRQRSHVSIDIFPWYPELFEFLPEQKLLELSFNEFLDRKRGYESLFSNKRVCLFIR